MKFADVWTTRDFVAAGLVLAGVALIALAQAFDWSRVFAVGGIVALIGAAVFVVGRVAGGPRGGRPDGV